MKLIHNVRQYISQNNLINPSDKLLIGVSGGADSVGLLIILNALKYDLGFSLHIAHYNHQLRATANADEKFVRNLANAMNIQCHISESKTLKHKTKGSLENLARNERLHFFKTIHKQYPYTKLTLAHNKDDLAETVLMHMLRGSGLKGISGIQPSTVINNQTIIRPLLNSSKHDIIQYLKAKNIKYRTDPSNKDIQYFRNKIRHRLLPNIKKNYSPNITELLSHSSISLNDDYDYIHSQSQKAYKRMCQLDQKKKTIQLEIKSFIRAHRSIQRMVLRLIYKEFNSNMNKLSLKHIISLEEFIQDVSKKGTIQWPNGIIANKSKNIVNFMMHNNT